MVKDTTLASELARDLSVPLLAGSLATQTYLACDARGWASHEHWAVMELFEALAGIGSGRRTYGGRLRLSAK